MGHVRGGTLSDFLLSSPHQPEDRLDAIIELVRRAIALLHAENLVFGDLRTPNVLIDDGVKLIDYDWCGVDGTVHHWRCNRVGDHCQRCIKITTLTCSTDWRQTSEQGLTQDVGNVS